MPLRGSRATWPTVVFCASEAPHLGLYCNFHHLNINQALDHLLGLYPAQYSLRFRPIFVDIPWFSMGYLQRHSASSPTAVVGATPRRSSASSISSSYFVSSVIPFFSLLYVFSVIFSLSTSACG
ncbi:hypothetical protein TB2_004420 [Malus domestica]